MKLHHSFVNTLYKSRGFNTQPNISDVSLRYVLNIDIRILLHSLGIVGIWKVVSLFFMFATAREIKFEMRSEMKTGTGQSYRTGKRIE